MPLEMLEIPVEPDIINDLAVIDNIENLKSSPFVTMPKKKEVFKPVAAEVPSENNPINNPISTPYQQAQQQVVAPEVVEPRLKTVKKKKELSEKQKAHLLKMRQKKIDKANKNLTKQVKNPDGSPTAVIEASVEELEYMEAQEFDHWLSQMEKFEKLIMKKRQAENKIKEAEAKKEAELEAKIRKKIELENKQRQGVQTNSIPEPPAILKQNDFGEFSSYFGYE